MSKYRRVFLFLLVLLLATAIVPIIQFAPVQAIGENWLTGWTYRKSLDIDGSTAGVQTDYQVEIEISGGGDFSFTELPTNAPTYQTTPTSDATGQCVHPSILYFPDGWNGYKYWMVMTPYAAGNDDVETPEILACDDGVNWVVPAGLTNPIVARDAADPNTDTCLFYNEATDELWVYYMKWDDPARTYNRLYLKKSSDGVDWSGTGLGTLLLTMGFTEMLSPAVVKVGATYHLWYIDATAAPNEVKHRTSADGESWGAEGTCNLYGTMPTGKESWHFEVRWMTEYSEYWMLLTICDLGASGPPGWLLFARSEDAIDWYLYPEVLLKPSAEGWDSSITYKATAILDDSTLKIWYSARESPPHVWHVGYTTATISFGNGMLSKIKSDGGDLRFTEDDGVTELDYWLESVSEQKIIAWVKMPSIPVAGTTIYVYYGKADATTTSSHTDTMIKSDDGVTGNFDEDTRGTAALSHVGGFYRITEDSDDDAFASGKIMTDWAWMADIRVFKIFSTGPGNDQVMFGLFDEDVIAQLCGTTGDVAGKRRFVISRYCSDPETPANGNRITINYWDAGDTERVWDGDSWELETTRHVAEGDLELRIWSDGTTLYADVLKDGVSIFAAPASIAIASVKAFSEGRLLAWCDLYTSHYFIPQDIDRYFIRKYVSPEPTLGAWGSEETEEGVVAPTVTTQSATDIGWDDGTYHATLHGTITDTGGENCDERGFDWGYSSGSYSSGWTETGSFGTGAFNRYITGLTGDTVYFRAKAHNSAGWGYGNEMSFPKPDPENNPPNAPTLSTPEADSRWDMWEYVSFTWTFSDPDPGDIQSAYQLQLDDDSDFSSPLINTGKVSSGASVYNGYIPNTLGLFYWRVKTWDNHDLDGNYSSGRTIITDRILVYDISSDDNRIDIGISATLTVHLHHEYDGADITTGSFTLMGLALTHQSGGDWTTTHSKSTPQSVTFNSVSGSTGNIDDVNMNGKTTTVIWDLIHATATQISDPRVSVNANVDIYFTLKYDYDETAVTDGTVTIEGETANHLGSGVWRITTSESTTQSITYDEFTASGNVYGITEVDAEGHSETAIWDRWKLTSFWASSYSPQTGTNVTLFAKGELEYDGHLPNGDDNLEIESIQFEWDWSQERYKTIVSKNTPGAITYDDLTDVYENTHGINVGTMSGLSVTVEWGNYTYHYDFYGLYNENGSRAGSVDLSVHLPSGTVIYPLDGNLTEGFNEQPELFSWSLEGGGTRFIFPYKVNESVYIFTPDATYSVYSFTIKDYTGKIGSSNAWLESIRSVNGTERMVERQLIWDTYNPVPLTLAQSQIYILQIRFADGSIHRFGYFVPGAEGTPTLYLYDIDFSDQAHIVAEHVAVEATRPTDTHIRVNYKDELDDTNEVFIEVCLLNGTQVWNDTGAGDILQFNWHGADNETDYRVNVEITHGFYGELTYTCWLAGAQSVEDPFDLTLFGDWPIEGAFAVFLIIGTACLFSRASSVIGIGVTVLVAAVLSGIGWINISYSVLAASFTLVVLWGLSGGGK